LRVRERLVCARGWRGGRAPHKEHYRPALTHSSWVNVKAGWYDPSGGSPPANPIKIENPAFCKRSLNHLSVSLSAQLVADGFCQRHSAVAWPRFQGA
jgi:hypothetical protein